MEKLSKENTGGQCKKLSKSGASARDYIQADSMRINWSAQYTKELGLPLGETTSLMYPMMVSH